MKGWLSVLCGFCLALPAEAAPFTLDGIRLGEPMGRVLARPVYARPCDVDPIDNGQRQIVLYAPRPCRGGLFPDGTTAIFFLDPHDGGPSDAAVRAVAYFGGTYLADRTALPVAVGTPLPAAGADGLAHALGLPVTWRHRFQGKGLTLHVTRFGADLYLFDDGRRVVGVGMGDWPVEPDREQWRAVFKIWRAFGTR